MQKIVKLSLTLLLLVMLSCHEEHGEMDKENLKSNLTKNNISKKVMIYYKDPSSPLVVLPFGGMDYITNACYVSCLNWNNYTGVVDVLNTMPGIYYPITYQNGQSTVTLNILVSGIRYQAGIYKEYQLATPLYNGADLQLPPGSILDTPPQGVPSLASQGIVLDPTTGAIKIAESLANGIFGEDSKEGDSRSFRLYYQLNDASNFTLNYTDLIFYNYCDPSSIPDDLLNNECAQNNINISTARTATEPSRCPIPIIVCKLSNTVGQ